jgi:hypothetical protein
MAHASRSLHPREVHQGALDRQKGGRGVFRALPKRPTEVESWRNLQSFNIEFTMKRLRDPIELPVMKCSLCEEGFE